MRVRLTLALGIGLSSSRVATGGQAPGLAASGTRAWTGDAASRRAVAVAATGDRAPTGKQAAEWDAGGRLLHSP